ncbi:ArsR/SmtB family transcription factor [Cellulomonas telluris]|uniref:ArsR/SmtB family transcription factor n=1 Tax=Cellulomonas telluris TaxID=2306636 RepID=UPI001CA460E1|nr:metalloregulator ArsR/SmtB family transcription factor [Cellulomonas telluris]
MSRNNGEGEESVFAALAHRSRRDILRHLRARDFVRAGDIGDALGIGPSTLSGHLRMLRAAGLVETRRRGTEIQYRLQMTVLDEAILLLHGLRPERADAATDPHATDPHATDPHATDPHPGAAAVPDPQGDR